MHTPYIENPLEVEEGCRVEQTPITAVGTLPFCVRTRSTFKSEEVLQKLN